MNPASALQRIGDPGVELHTPDPGDGLAIQNKDFITFVQIEAAGAGAETRIMAAPWKQGLQLIIKRIASQGGAGAITIDSNSEVDASANTKWAFANGTNDLHAISIRKSDGTYRWDTITKTAGTTYVA